MWHSLEILFCKFNVARRSVCIQNYLRTVPTAKDDKIPEEMKTSTTIAMICVKVGALPTRFNPYDIIWI